MADKPTQSTRNLANAAFDTDAATAYPLHSSFPSWHPVTAAKPQTQALNSSTMAVESKKPLDISNLMSPPEPTPFDTFSHGQMATATRATATPGKASVPRPPLSPPISPFAKPASVIDPSHNTIHGVVKDPILYPSSDVSSSPPQPLFNEDGSSIETRRVVDEHVAARPTTLFDHSTPPEREHYELALYFQSEVMKKFMRNPRGWLRKEREQLLADRRANSGRCQVKRPLKAIVPAEGTQPVIRVAFGGIPKPEAALSAVTNSKSTIRVKVSRPIRVNPQPNKSPRRVSPTPEPRSRTVAPNREDKDFASLPDYCPPLASLPSKQNSLKVDWKGNALDLSNDPFRHLLHPDELALAAGLRLDCATYLTSKRRIFMRRLDCFRIGKEFRKTDAQQACKIDVNKASKLWTAYEKVGWLNKEWMRHFA